MADDTSGRTAGPTAPGRRFIVLGIAATLSGCVQTVMEAEAARGVTIRAINVDTSRLKAMEIRGLPIAKDRFAKDLEAAIGREIASRRSKSGNADLYVVVTRVHLVSSGQSFMVGGRSFIDASIVVVRRSDGARIGELDKFSGWPEVPRMGGIVGALSAPSPAEDYAATLAGFADMLEDALFEGGSSLV